MPQIAPRHAQPTVEPAAFKKEEFTCSACGGFAFHQWAQLLYGPNPRYTTHLWRCECGRCGAVSYWFDTGRQVDPHPVAGPPPHADMPEQVQRDYLEAAAVVEVSPRSACALLRNATETLLRELGDDNKSLNDNIKLVRQREGLPSRVIKAMDVLRVVGNNAVHELELDLRDDQDTATSLFELVNLIVEQCISQHRQIDGMFDRLPTGAKEAIAKRDAATDVGAAPPA